jgi:predicted nucleic acid-binding Zn ribbon protein
MEKSGLSDADMFRLQFHIANGTALGYSYLNGFRNQRSQYVEANSGSTAEGESGQQNQNNSQQGEGSSIAQTRPPSFNTLWKNHNERDDIILELGDDGKLKYPNQCAVRMSEALIESGVKLKGFDFYADSKYPQYALRALEMRAFYTLLYGEPTIIKGNQDATKILQGKQGIVVIEGFLSNGRRWNHTDLWNGSEFRGGDPKWMNKSKQRAVYFWEVK